jgi:hypothetical protein
MYGLFYQKNLFYDKFWYKNLLKQATKLKNQNKSLYFRKYYYAHQTLTIEHSYFLRLKTSEYFPLKLYIMRYNNWLVASVQWFKPVKKNIKNKLVYSNSNSNIQLGTNFLKKSQTNKRVKILFLLLRTSLGYFKKSTSYSF